LTIFIAKYPRALSKDFRIFFCKYNDPSYVKRENLNIILGIATNQNAVLVLDELEEYCNFVDVGFVRKVIHVIGQIAIKLEITVRRCVDILVKLIESQAEYAVEEANIVFQNIFRKFPGHFEKCISTICSNFE
jgi:vesicle coat complex subunit